MALPELSAVLWRQRDLLEVLLFKLTEEQLLLAADHVRWLPRATREVEVVLSELQRAELARAAEAEGVALAMGLSPEASLRELAAAAEAPWDELLAQHHRGMEVLTAEVREVARVNEDLLRRGSRTVELTLQDAFGGLPGQREPGGYRADGRQQTTATGGRLVDGRL